MTEPNIESALTPISEARRMLAQASTLPELRELRDFATGAKAWAKARGMGIDAENEATEIILRAEREIGQNLLQLRAEGRYGSKSAAGSLGRLVGGSPIPQRSLTAEGTAELETRLADVVLLRDIGIKPDDAQNFQRLAGIEDDRFEAMIRAVKAIEGARLAKANFYKSIEKAERVRTGTTVLYETPSDPGFAAFLTARNALLGWEVSEKGVAGPTRNGLMALPDDQLATLAEAIKAFAYAYNEVRRARSG